MNKIRAPHVNNANMRETGKEEINCLEASIESALDSGGRLAEGVVL